MGDLSHLLGNPSLVGLPDDVCPAVGQPFELKNVNLKAPPITWEEVEGGLFQPTITVGLFAITTSPRPVKEFIVGERDFILDALSSDLSKFIFGVDRFVFTDDGDDSIVTHHPDFVALPVYTP